MKCFKKKLNNAKVFKNHIPFKMDWIMCLPFMLIFISKSEHMGSKSQENSSVQGNTNFRFYITSKSSPQKLLGHFPFLQKKIVV